MAKVVWLKTGARRVHGYRVVAVDWTMEEDYWILMASVCVKKRAVPLLWHVVPRGEFDVSQTAKIDYRIYSLNSLSKLG